jgi:hypothetical protein
LSVDLPNLPVLTPDASRGRAAVAKFAWEIDGVFPVERSFDETGIRQKPFQALLVFGNAT